MGRLAQRLPLAARRRIVRLLRPAVWKRVRVYVHGRHPLQVKVRELSTLPMRRLSSARPCRVIIHDDRVLLAQPVHSFHADAVLARNLAHVVQSFRTAEVDHVVLEADAAGRRVIVVPEAHRAAALAALRRSLAGSATYVGVVRDGEVRHATPAARGVDRLDHRVTVIRVFDVLCSAKGDYVSGAELGCDVEFWCRAQTSRGTRELGEGSQLRAPRNNLWIDLIGPDEWNTASREADGVPGPVLTTLRHPHLLTVTTPIDVVYTWVDGSDPDWLARLERTREQYRLTAPRCIHSRPTGHVFGRGTSCATPSARWTCMRDWVRHVYLVTDDQVPTWLDTDNARITLVTHRELFEDRGRLPTFNSHAIESQLHHIAGLSEHFLYLNDDVFFGRPVDPAAVHAQQRADQVLPVHLEDPAGRRRPARHSCDERGQEQPRFTGASARTSGLEQVPARAALLAPVGDGGDGVQVRRGLRPHGVLAAAASRRPLHRGVPPSLLRVCDGPSCP